MSPPPLPNSLPSEPAARRRANSAAPAWRRGFTLVELMIAMAVMTVLLAVAVPSLSDFAANNQLSATKSNFAAAVALARTEATKRGRVVILQALGSGSTGNEYANGWELVVDDDGNGAAGTSETRVRKNALSLTKVRLSGPTTLAFRASGALSQTSAQVFTLCRIGGGPRGYSVTVVPSGATDVNSAAACG